MSAASNQNLLQNDLFASSDSETVELSPELAVARAQLGSRSPKQNACAPSADEERSPASPNALHAGSIGGSPADPHDASFKRLWDTQAPEVRSGESECYLSVRSVADRYETSPATIWRWAKQRPDFPKPIRIANGTSRWRLSELIAFEASCSGSL